MSRSMRAMARWALKSLVRRHGLIIRCLSIEVEPSKHLVDKAIGQPTAGAPAAGKTNRLIRAKEPSRKKEKPSPVAPGLGL